MRRIHYFDLMITWERASSYRHVDPKKIAVKRRTIDRSEGVNKF